MKCRRRVGFALLLLLVAGGTSTAGVQTVEGFGYDRLFPGATFDPAIPTQEAVTGVKPGSRPLRHAELLGYFQALAEASPRARLTTYSRSHEGRELVYLAVSDEATVAGLDEFRGEHARRVDPRERPASGDAVALKDAKAVAWIAYAIHGDELSSADAAAAMAYWLVAGEDERARRLRDQLVILIDPLENPDGRDRFLAQTLAFAHATPNPDREDLSHTTVWPWGRGNHYLFDLNRDWFAQVQPESRRSVVIATWNPQLMVDSHEMGADDTYLFPPSRHPFNPHLPDYHGRWNKQFGADQAAALDERGYAYYTREWNEEFFPGYGSSWASYLGAIGILYEMSSTQGTLVRQRPGTLRTYPEAVEHHVASSVANLQTLADHRGEILADFVAARREAVAQGSEGPRRAWVFPPDRDIARHTELRELLTSLGIETQYLGSPIDVKGAHDIRTGTVTDLELPTGTWMVRLDQPAAPMARVLLDPHVPMRATFLQEEREYLERGKGTRLYETTAWSLPLAYGLPAYWLPQVPKGSWESPACGPRPVRPLEQASDVYGYLMNGGTHGSTRVLAELLQQGLAVRVADRDVRVGGHEYERGALLVKREGNPTDLAERLSAIHRATVADRFEPTTTALAEHGPDLGGGHFQPLVAPRVGVWAGWPVRPDHYGWVWNLFDRELGLRFSGLDLGRFNATDLSRYNVLVFPGTMGGQAYKRALGESGIEKLKEWIDAGGTAIGLGNGAGFLADKEVGLTATRLRRQAIETDPPVVVGIDAPAAEAAGTFRAVGLRVAGDESESEGESAASDSHAETRDSPYDVAPILGPGAAPFVEGVEQGTPVSMKPVALRDWVRPFLPSGRIKPETSDLERAERRLRRFAPQGAFLRVDLDPEQWLNFGLPVSIAAWVGTSQALVADHPVKVPARFGDIERLQLGGLLWPEGAGRLAHTAYATREGVGRGQVVLFVDNPVYRGWMHETRRMFVNAVLYGPGLGTDWSSPW